MNSLFDAYQAYERQVIRGEFNKVSGKTADRSVPREPLLVKIGDLLIQIGQKLKQRHSTGKPMTWSPVIGSRL
jgi:hypothetical protein